MHTVHAHAHAQFTIKLDKLEQEPKLICVCVCARREYHISISSLFVCISSHLSPGKSSNLQPVSSLILLSAFSFATRIKFINACCRCILYAQYRPNANIRVPWRWNRLIDWACVYFNCSFSSSFVFFFIGKDIRKKCGLFDFASRVTDRIFKRQDDFQRIINCDEINGTHLRDTNKKSHTE